MNDPPVNSLPAVYMTDEDTNLTLSGPALGVTDIARLIDLLLAIWLHIALGSVLRHALAIPLLAGVIIMLSYTVLAFNVIVRMFPLAVSA